MPYLLDLLARIKLLGDDQIRTLRVKINHTRQRLQLKQQRAGRGSRYHFSDVEVLLETVSEVGLTTPSGTPLSEDQLMEEVARDTGLPYLKLDPLKLDAKLITDTFAKKFARHNIIIPVAKHGKTLVLATDNPFNLQLQDSLARSLPAPPDYVVASKSDILKIITEFYGFRSSVAAAASDFSDQVDLNNFEQFVALKDVNDLEADDAHVVNAVEYLLHYALNQRASDIHVEPKREHSAVRLRIDGILHTINQMPRVVHAPFTSRIKMLARMDIAERRRPQDGRIKTQQGAREIEMRVSTLPVAFGEKVVIRILDPAHLMQDIEAIGMGSDELTRYQQILSNRTGLVLVTGPTGSGKTTTLYSTLRTLASPDVNITTLEDPIEMVYEPFNQVQVQPQIGLTFADTLRTILRQDPDIIMVGEIRDEATAEMAVQAALTGHLVFSTLHTNDAASTVARLLDFGIKPFLLASTLVGVLAQRLLRRNCPDCQREVFLNENQLAMLDLKLPARSQRKLPVRKGTGCVTCRHTGMLGRTAVIEVLNVNETIRRLIQREADATEILKAARADGMLTLKEAAIRKMAQGEAPFDEVVRVLGV